MFGHSRHGETQVIIVIGMVLMLILGAVIDRVFLLQALPTARIQELLHLEVTQTPVSTPASVPTTQGQRSPSAASSSPVHVVPRYLGSAGAKIASSVEMTSGPTYSGWYIEGVIRNKSSKTVSYVSIGFDVYDSSGNKLDPTSASFGSLGPGETWRYEALILDNDAAAYKLVGVESF